jgi:hypothetical protein
MPRLRDKPIEKDDFLEYLKSHDDFQFELDVFRLCLAGGATVEHGGIYSDPITKKDRQFDIRILFQKGQLLVRLAVECKNLKSNYPLLVSRIPRSADEAFHEIILSRQQSLLLHGVNAGRSIRVQGAEGLFNAGEPVGKSTAQVGRTPGGDLLAGDAEVYEKWAQALASASDLVRESVDDYKLTHTPEAATVVIPILVVADGTLWTIDYSADGAPMADPRCVESCEIFLRKDIWTGPMGIGYTFSHLLVFTKSKFDGYLDRLATNDLYWDRIFPKKNLEGTLILKGTDEV